MADDRVFNRGKALSVKYYSQSIRGSNMLKIINKTVVFLIELIMFGSFAYFGFQIGDGLFEKYELAIALPLLAIVLWAYWAAPKSKKRLTMPYLALFRLTLFVLAAFLLYRCRHTTFALILACVSAVTQIASVFLENND